MIVTSAMLAKQRESTIRLREHILGINKKTGFPFIISNYRVNFNHNFRWNDVKKVNLLITKG